MYIGEEIFGCTTGFLSEITQINFSQTNYLISKLISYHVLKIIKTLVNYNRYCHYDILNDQDIIIYYYANVWKI